MNPTIRNLSRLSLILPVFLILALSRNSYAAEKDVGPKLGLQTWTLRHMTFDQVVDFAAKNNIRYLQLISSHLDPNAEAAETRRKLAILQVLATRDRRIGVCLDVGWITAAGFDAARVFRDYGDRVYDIHFKDKKLQPGVEPTVVDTQIGGGDANYSDLFAEIKKSGWSGVMAIETDSEGVGHQPESSCCRCNLIFQPAERGLGRPLQRQKLERVDA